MIHKVNMQSLVTMIITGQSPEKVINMATSRGIPVWSIKDLSGQAEQGLEGDLKGQVNQQWELQTSVAGVRPLFRLARRGNCRLKIISKKGPIFWLSFMKRRKSLVVGGLLFCLGLLSFSQFIWFVEVSCPTPLLEQSAREIMGEYGLTRFSLRSAVDIDFVREQLTIRLPEAAWIGVELVGSRLTVEVVEKKDQADPELFGDGDLVAIKAGVIQEILVLQGTSRTQVGENVQEGQILIAGLQYSDKTESGWQPIRARGLVRAKVERRIEAECPLQEEVFTDTGNEAVWYQIQTKGRDIRLNGVPAPPYDAYRLVKNVKTLWQGRNQGDIVEFITVIYKEQSRSVIQRNVQEAVTEGLRRAQKSLLQEMPEDCRILRQEALPVSKETDGMVRICLLIETLEDIGKLLPAQS